MKLYVSNLSPKTTEEHLKELFERYGVVSALKIERNRRAGRLDGMAIVLMEPSGAMSAIRELNGRTFNNRRLYVNLIDQWQPRNRPYVALKAQSEQKSK